MALKPSLSEAKYLFLMSKYQFKKMDQNSNGCLKISESTKRNHWLAIISYMGLATTAGERPGGGGGEGSIYRFYV